MMAQPRLRKASWMGSWLRGAAGQAAAQADPGAASRRTSMQRFGATGLWHPRRVAEGIAVVAYSGEWPALFADVGQRLRRELGDVALRIDHIGSTAVPGLDAKPVIDLQVSVASLEPLAVCREPIERAGFVHRADNPELTKRYFRERPGARRTHIHVRRAGSFSEQFALLFREYLRAHPEHAATYAALKRSQTADRERPQSCVRTQREDHRQPASKLLPHARLRSWTASS